MAQAPTLKIKRVLLSSLIEDPKNARKHNARNLDAIQASLTAHAQVEPLVVQASTRKVIGGNGRLSAMRALGWTHADIVEVDMKDAQAAALGVTLNRTAELAEWDDAQLAETLKQLQAQEFKLDALGFDDDDLRKVLVKEHERTLGGPPDKPPEERVQKRENIARGKRVFDVTCGDSLKALASMPENSVDAVVCDPPYELTTGNGKTGFMGQAWDGSGIAFNVELWKQVLRVLKPGGHLLAFGGTRTYHRMTCAIEDAGFEIRDCLSWLYGSGFPKSHNVSKSMDDAAGEERPDRETLPPGTNKVFSPSVQDLNAGRPVTDAAKQWDGWGTALKPAHEPIVMARKPLSESTIAANVLRWGTGALNIRSARIPHASEEDKAQHQSMIDNIKRKAGVGWGGGDGSGEGNVAFNASNLAECNDVEEGGRWPANLLLDRHTARLLDQQIGADDEISGVSRFFYVAKPSRAERDAGLQDVSGATPAGMIRNAAERGRSVADTLTGRKNIHPTVKPADLMHHLCVMVCPPGGLVLDPFTGSGTTGIGAVLGNFRFTGIELDPIHVEIALKRIQWWASQYE